MSYLIGLLLTKDGKIKPLELSDFLFIAPYNAQVRALKSSPAERRPSRQRRQVPRPRSSRLHPVALLQLRRIRLTRPEIHPRPLPINVAISRAKCLADRRRRPTHRKLRRRLDRRNEVAESLLQAARVSRVRHVLSYMAGLLRGRSAARCRFALKSLRAWGKRHFTFQCKFASKLVLKKSALHAARNR